MADRPHRGTRGGYRGRGGGAGGRGRGGGGGSEGFHHGGGGYHYHGGGGHHHGGGVGGGHGHTHSGSNVGQDRERPKKENILDLAKYMDKEIQVQFNGGRIVTGTLKGYDALMNLVLDEVHETMRNAEGAETKRSLGLVVARGTLLVAISPLDGSEPIANPFLQVTGDDD